MVDSASFSTRARTIDHLGREQIADIPTAISELWKNAYDAYARKVELHIFDGESPVCALVDDGHGMNRQEFEEKWLTVGTESKATSSTVPKKDRNDLDERPKQGQKGIGRLSCAALGKLLLIISKRKDSPFIASLLDWRLFENPYLMLHDIQIPIVEFNHQDELNEHLPSLFDTLMGNIWGDGKDSNRDTRLAMAWDQFEQQELNEGIDSTKEAIEKTIIEESFSYRHFSVWDVWNGDSVKGTAMFMADINDDLTAQLPNESLENLSGEEIRARNTLLQTLSNFTDPLGNNNQFVNAIYAWNGQLKRAVIDETSDFTSPDFEELEHTIEGEVDENGFFNGHIKAFNQWHDNITIKPKVRYRTRKDTRFGSFNIKAGAYEGRSNWSSLPDEVHARFEELSLLYGGLMVYRDGLRVMPFGREDNDYFEIEKRRSINAGKFVWSNRRLFGRISISRSQNPNLKDKAGREGLIDNKASKLFRELVENILIEVAERFIGRNSPYRESSIEDNKAKKEAEKAQADKKKILRKERNRIKKTINQNLNALQGTVNTLTLLAKEFSQQDAITDLEQAKRLKNQLGDFNEEVKNYSLSPVPSNLGSVEETYREYRSFELQAKSLTKQLDSSVNAALERLEKKSAYEIAARIFRSKAAQHQAKVRNLSKEGYELLQQASTEFKSLVDERNKAYHAVMADSLEDLQLERTSLGIVLDKLDDEFIKQDLETIQKLKPYVTALQNISVEIDLEGLAINSLNEAEKWRKEAARLHQLAQLGITVEIIGHEIEGLDMTITRGLKTLAGAQFSEHQKQAYDSILYAQQSLSDKWRFLSPLKLSGDKARIKITGKKIAEYIAEYFQKSFDTNHIDFIVTDRFNRLSLFEQPARLFPVFINLVNNARYWVKQGDSEKHKILLDISEEEVIVADNGSGVEYDDLDQLFTLFFTRKQRRGRGVGLYLCKQNLQAGGHSIRYENNDDKKLLPGANFAIKLKGANFD